MATRKSTTSTANKKKIVCNICGKEQALVNYYVSDREEYSDIGKAPYCKKCLQAMIIDSNTGKITVDKFKSALKILNLPFVNSLYVEVMSNDNTNNSNALGRYIKQIGLKPDIKSATYADSVMFEIKEEQIKNSKVEEIKKEEVTEEMVLFWGKGLSNEDYLDLQERFDRFMEAEDGREIDYKKEMDYKKLVIWEFQLSKIQYDIDKLKESEKLQNMILDLSNDLGIKAIQKKEDKNNNRHYIIGVITKFIEDVKKEPILKPSDYMKGYSKTEFEKELELHFTAPLLESFEMNNPFKDEWENEKKKYEPTKEEIDAFANDKGVDD